MIVTAPRVVVLADDLIWSGRLAASVREAGGEATVIRSAASLGDALAGKPAGAIVDLTARAYDGVVAIGSIAAAGVAVLAVGPHDDRDLLRRARAAGASRALAYRKLADDGPATIRAWMDVARRHVRRGPPAPEPAVARSARVASGAEAIR